MVPTWLGDAGDCVQVVNRSRTHVVGQTLWCACKDDEAQVGASRWQFLLRLSYGMQQTVTGVPHVNNFQFLLNLI